MEVDVHYSLPCIIYNPYVLFIWFSFVVFFFASNEKTQLVVALVTTFLLHRNLSGFLLSISLNVCLISWDTFLWQMKWIKIEWKKKGKLKKFFNKINSMAPSATDQRLRIVLIARTDSQVPKQKLNESKRVGGCKKWIVLMSCKINSIFLLGLKQMKGPLSCLATFVLLL